MNMKVFDIFEKRNKKEKKEKPAETIITDYREKNCLVPASLIRLGLNVEFKELKIADYLVRDIAIERKTISDFLSSMINKRLINQLKEMEQYENRLLIIEGFSEQDLYSDSAENTGINANAIRGFLLSIIFKHKTPVLFSKNPEDTARIIAVLAKRKEKEISIKEKRKGNNTQEQKQLIIESFPGIGPKTAKKLLSEFRTIERIINTPEEDLKKSIGKKADIFRLAREDY
jgi:ERCC4-type nuclease